MANMDIPQALEPFKTCNRIAKHNDVSQCVGLGGSVDASLRCKSDGIDRYLCIAQKVAVNVPIKLYKVRSNAKGSHDPRVTVDVLGETEMGQMRVMVRLFVRSGRIGSALE